MIKKLVLLFISLFVVLINVKAQNPRLSTPKQKIENKLTNQENKAKFEFGLHYGKAWTTGKTKELAKSGDAFGINMGVNNGTFYIGTELTISNWKNFQKSKKAEDANFKKSNFLWLAQVKIFLGDGDVKPYIGIGTDLISLVRIATKSKEDNEYNHRHVQKEQLNYNAWVSPTFGLRWKMGTVNGNLGFTANLSKNYGFNQLQLGIVF